MFNTILILRNHLQVNRNNPFFLGVIFVMILTFTSIYLSALPLFKYFGLSVLTIAILLGIIAGNTFFPYIALNVSSGVDFCKGRLLRVGIILYGFRITFQQISSVNLSGILIDFIMVFSVFTLAFQLGVRVFRLDRQTAMLIGAGSAICGAAAVIAAGPVLRARSEEITIAVATVVIFGTLSMFLYPLLFPYLGLSQKAYGIFVGSTVHEVAQVVAAGKNISDYSASIAVIEKMLRVILLAPFLLILSHMQKKSQVIFAFEKFTHRGIVVPWFAIMFILVGVINSFHFIPVNFINYINRLDTVILSMAMTALGLHTQSSAFRRAGFRPLMLAGVLFIFLIMGGYCINRIVTLWLD